MDLLTKMEQMPNQTVSTTGYVDVTVSTLTTVERA